MIEQQEVYTSLHEELVVELEKFNETQRQFELKSETFLTSQLEFEEALRKHEIAAQELLVQQTEVELAQIWIEEKSESLESLTIELNELSNFTIERQYEIELRDNVTVLREEKLSQLSEELDILSERLLIESNELDECSKQVESQLSQLESLSLHLETSSLELEHASLDMLRKEQELELIQQEMELHNQNWVGRHDVNVNIYENETNQHGEHGHGGLNGDIAMGTTDRPVVASVDLSSQPKWVQLQSRVLALPLKTLSSTLGFALGDIFVFFRMLPPGGWCRAIVMLVWLSLGVFAFVNHSWLILCISVIHAVISLASMGGMLNTRPI